MSRLAQVKAVPIDAKDGRLGSGDAKDDVCPVCKSSRYMNQHLKLLINPTCYHRMCQSCVDRVFLNGKAVCPLPGCAHTLKKSGFRAQTFEDLRVEREVDIRHEVARIFNRREDDFEDLRGYNDYLNTVEDMVFNLVHGVDVEETRRRFEQYKAQHEKEIRENASLARQEERSYQELQRTEREQARQRREAARREEADERRVADEDRRDLLRRLETGQDAVKVAREGQQIALRRRQDRVGGAGVPEPSVVTAAAGDDQLAFKGLKALKKAESEAPVDPFGGITFVARYFALQDDYVWDAVQESKKDPVISAGGYDVASYTSRALSEAFSGLGVFVADEATGRQEAAQNSEAVATARAEIGVRDMKTDDPF